MFFIRTGAVNLNGTGEVRLTPPTDGDIQGHPVLPSAQQ
jgi:hypothetical protein